jgi:VWFA-related protein
MRLGAVLAIVGVAVQAQSPPTFQTRSHEVLVPVSVTGERGKLVEDLQADDFVVLSDDKPQKIRMLDRDSNSTPVHAVLVLQANDSGDAVLAKIRKTASVVSTYITNQMQTAGPSLAGVITVSDDVQVRQSLTADADLLTDAILRLKGVGESGRLLDGVSLACDLLAERKEPARRVIVLIGESRDRQSKMQFADVVVKAQKTDAAIYTLSYSAYATAFTQKASDRPPPPDQPGLYDSQAAGGMNLLAIGIELARLAKVNVAEGLAQATGGIHGKFTTLHGLEEQLTAIGHDVHNRYTLTFAPPPDQSAGYHRINVEVHRPPTAHVHARTGYWSGSE